MLCNVQICASLGTVFRLNKKYLELVITVVCYALHKTCLCVSAQFFKKYIF